MESFVRAATVYLALLVLFRIAGRRTLSQITNFDFVLLLIIGEAVQQGLLGNDFSLTHAFLVVMTLILIDIFLSLVKQHSTTVEKWLDGVPVILVDHGRVLQERLNKARVDEEDVLEAAREKMGLERLEQIKYAILEKGGDITVVPYRTDRADEPRSPALRAQEAL
jgi:uncharacterized membrane protein YcaP (DUF421 family)